MHSIASQPCGASASGPRLYTSRPHAYGVLTRPSTPLGASASGVGHVLDGLVSLVSFTGMECIHGLTTETCSLCLRTQTAALDALIASDGFEYAPDGKVIGKVQALLPEARAFSNTKDGKGRKTESDFSIQHEYRRIHEKPRYANVDLAYGGDDTHIELDGERFSLELDDDNERSSE